jgi:DNA-binding protein Fis
MDTVTINLDDKNRISLVIEGVTLELVVKRTEDLPGETQAGQPDTVLLSLEETRKIQTRHVLDMCKGNHSRAAQILGISRTSLWRYLKCNSQTAVSENINTARLEQRVS